VVSDEPIRRQLLEAEIDKAFNEFFETDQPNPTEDNPHAAVFDEMADDLYQTMLQEQAKEEAAAGLLPAQTNAAAAGWTNDGSIQYNMQEEISAAPFAQQEYLRQFWDETKQRFSAGKLLFDTQPYGSFQPAFAVADNKSFYGVDSNDTSNQINVGVDKHSNIIKQFAAQGGKEKSSDFKDDASQGEHQTKTTNKGNEIDITPEKNHRTAARNPGPYATACSSVDIVDKNGNIKTRRWYDKNGRAYRDVDMTNHGNPKAHPQWPHEHTWDWSTEEPIRK
jgi:hypothetical protein